MTPRLRSLIDHVSRSAEADTVLLRKFAESRDPQAFAELVRRYGRLVWGQCRHLLAGEADADDAFQATFLTLAKSAKVIRDTNKLGPWLHGVAYRVCQQVHRTSARRAKREKASARSEAARPVADSAWDQAFATVHAELAQLPDTLRAPFILCVLEGKGTTEAANQLGLKLGTFSARLSRAKQTLFERLSARGLTAGLAAVGAVAVGASNVPAAVSAKACDLVAGGPVPANILSLSHGVLGMATMNAKRWVMAVLASGGLALGMGGVWTANAQDKPKEATKELTKTEAQDEKKRVLDDLKKKVEAEEAKLREYEGMYKKHLDEAKKQLGDAQKKWSEADYSDLTKLFERVQKDGDAKSPEFLYLGQKAGFAPTAGEFEETVKGVEAKGYTFVGVVTMKGQTKGKDGEAVPTLVFRRASVTTFDKVTGKLLEQGFRKVPDKAAAEKLLEKQLEKPGTKQPEKVPPTAADDLKEKALQLAKEKQLRTAKENADEKALQARIDQLAAELLALKKKQADKSDDGLYLGTLAEFGGNINEAAELVHGLLTAKFGAEASRKVKVTGDSKKGVLVYDATKEQAAWLLDITKQLKPGGSNKNSNNQSK